MSDVSLDSLSADGRGALRCVGVVMAGGAGRRMGADKAFIEIDGVPLVSRALRALREAGLSETLVVGGGPRRLDGLGLRHAPDRHPGEGPLGAVITALSAVSADADAVVTLPCDLIEPEPAAIRAVRECLEAERVGERVVSSGARPWPERPVSAANKSGGRIAGPRGTIVYPRAFSEEAAGGGPAVAVIPTAAGEPQWLHAAWLTACLPALSAAFASGERSLRRAVADLRCLAVEVPGDAWHRDADRREDLPGTAVVRAGHSPGVGSDASAGSRGSGAVRAAL